MNIPDYVKENLYLPYFRRLGARARSQQVLLGAGITLLVLGSLVAVLLWSRQSTASKRS